MTEAQLQLVTVPATPTLTSTPGHGVFRTIVRDTEGRIIRSYETEARRRDRIMSHVATGDGCWEWLAYRQANGYGIVSVDGRLKKAHRVVYELVVGPIPEGLTLDHLCRNRGCVNPAHLEPVTGRVNTLRGEGPSARAARKTHCPRGHPYDEDNTERYRGHRYCRACQRGRKR